MTNLITLVIRQPDGHLLGKSFIRRDRIELSFSFPCGVLSLTLNWTVSIPEASIFSFVFRLHYFPLLSGNFAYADGISDFRGYLMK